MPSSITGSSRPWSAPGGQDGLVPVGPNHHLSWSSSTSQESCYEERCVDPVEERTQEHQGPKVAHYRDAQSRKAKETIGYIPRSADSPHGNQGCGPCAPSSPGSCKNWVCSVLTCGLYRVCRSTILASCLAPSPRGRSPDNDQEKVSLRGLQSHPGSNDPRTRKEVGGGGSDWSEDIYIRGVKVYIPRMEEEPVVITRPLLHNGGGGGGGGRRYSPPSYSWYEGDMGDLSMGNVDTLITQKLLELYSEYQIEELAHCTSDSVFLKKTCEISQLISDLAEEHQLDEQDAECRLVKGIIRISTRKSKKNKKPQFKRSQKRTSDSGNETMSNYQTSTTSNNNDYDIQISKGTDSDMNARNMRMNSGEGPQSEHDDPSSTLLMS